MIKFTKIRLRGRTNIDIPIAWVSPDTAYQVRDISGLGPTEVDVLIGTAINGVGSYQGRRPRPRQIVITVGLNPDFGVEETYSILRHKIYEMTSTIDNMIVLEFWNEFYEGSSFVEEHVAETTVVYSKIDSNLFSEEPALQITLNATESNLHAPEPFIRNPFTANTNLEDIVTNEGNVATGFNLDFILQGDIPGGLLISCSNTSLPLPPTMLIKYDFLAFDKVSISTMSGFRFATVERNGVVKNLLSYVMHDGSPYVTWPQLMVGENTIKLDRKVNPQIPISVAWGEFSYLPLYMGV